MIELVGSPVFEGSIVADNATAFALAAPAVAPRFDDFWGSVSGWTTPSSPGEGTLEVDPQFVDANAGDYHLAAGSLCIDAGDPTLLDPDGSPADMGAFGGPEGAWTPP